MRRPISFLCAALAATACANRGGAAAADIGGIEWVATDIAGEPAIGGKPPTLRLLRDRTVAGGHAGCNIWSGAYRIERRRIALSDLTTTRRACAEPLMRQESAYLKLLSEANRYSATPTTLMLTTPSGTSISFIRPR